MPIGSGICAFLQMSGAFIFQLSGNVVVLPSSSLFMVERGGAGIDLHCEQRWSQFLHHGWSVMCNTRHFFVLCSVFETLDSQSHTPRRHFLRREKDSGG